MSDNGIGLSCDEFEAFPNLLLGVPRHGADLSERARHLLLSAGDKEAGSCHSVVGSALEMFLLMDLFKESIAAVLCA